MSRARDRADGVLHNRTHEDTEGGRESIVTFKGEQSGGEISTLAQIQASHDGTGDDQKSDLIFKTNGGSDGTSPSEAARIDSGQNLLIGTTSTTVYTSGSGGDAGVNLRADGQISNSSNSASVFNRMASDGPINLFYKDGSEVGRIVTGGGDLAIGTGTTSGMRFNDALSNVLPYNVGGVAYSDNAIDLGYSTVRWKDLYLSGGVYLGGTTSSNELDDYEEGTWTPTITSGGSSFTYTVQQGRYTKIGDLAHVKFYLQISAGTMTSAQFKVGNFPFTSAATHYTIGTGWNNASGSSIAHPVVMLPPISTTSFFYTQGGQNLSIVSGTTMGSGLSQLWSFTYYV